MCENLSPMMQQYMRIKEQHKDEILFFRLGDFYEMFFDDALKASKELDLTLTGRDCGLDERAPMCGVPYHSCEGYIQRLLKKGYNVAICEQVTEPQKGRTLVEREVVRIYTPGTVLETGMLEEGKNNFLCSIATDKNTAGMCLADISTGQMLVTQLSGKDCQQKIIDQLGKFSPSEILLCQNSLQLKRALDDISEQIGCQVVKLVGDQFEPEQNARRIADQFGVADPSELGLTGKPLCSTAISILLHYLDHTQQKGVERIRELTIYQTDSYMNLDLSSRRNLELTETMRTGEKRGSLLWVLDKTKTAMGKRLIRSFVEQPLTGIVQIEKRLDAVGQLMQNLTARSEITEHLQKISDLQRLMSRIVFGSAGPKEVRALAYTASQLPSIRQSLTAFDCDLLRQCRDGIDPLNDLKALIDEAIEDDPPVTLKDGRVIRYGYNPQVDELRDLIDHSKDILLRMEAQVKEETGIRNLKVGYNKVFGYYIEVSKGQTDLVPDSFIRKETLTNCERYITQELKELESRILNASDEIIALERQLYDGLCKKITAQIARVEETSHQLALLDTLISFAAVSERGGYVRPTVTAGEAIRIKDGRHPVVEKLQKDVPFVPNDTLLDERDNQIAIITGPNMAGKSTYMRQVALITLMAQMGCFVPASSAEIGIVDAVFTRVGASDDLAAGKSTFMVEMSEVAHILQNASRHSLLILDEIGRGTSTFDGMSIARAVLEYIGNRRKLGAKTLFATHYHELTALEESFSNVKNYNIAVKKRGDDITFLRRIVPGGADESYGIEVAKLAGVNDFVVNRAKEILASLESQDQPRHRQAAPRHEEEQPNLFAMSSQSKLEERIKQIDVNTLTPIEALNILYELAQMVKE